MNNWNKSQSIWVEGFLSWRVDEKKGEMEKGVWKPEDGKNTTLNYISHLISWSDLRSIFSVLLFSVSDLPASKFFTLLPVYPFPPNLRPEKRGLRSAGRFSGPPSTVSVFLLLSTVTVVVVILIVIIVWTIGILRGYRIHHNSTQRSFHVLQGQ